jgi:outer membrane biosynthesis protein TonB
METKGAARRKRTRSNQADDGAAGPVAASDLRANKKMKIDDDSSTSGSAQDTAPAILAAPAVTKFTRKGKISINFEEVNDEDAGAGKRPAIAVASSTETVTVQPAKAITSKSSPSSDEGKKKEKKDKKEKKEKKEKKKEKKEKKDKKEKKEKKAKREEKSEASNGADVKRVHELRKHEKKLDLSRAGQQDGANAVTNTVEVAHVKGLHPTIVQYTIVIHTVSCVVRLTCDVIRNLEQQFGITQFFPIQAQVIPVILRSVACGGCALPLLAARAVVRVRCVRRVRSCVCGACACACACGGAP